MYRFWPTRSTQCSQDSILFPIKIQTNITSCAPVQMENGVSTLTTAVDDNHREDLQCMMLPPSKLVFYGINTTPLLSLRRPIHWRMRTRYIMELKRTRNLCHSCENRKAGCIMNEEDFTLSIPNWLHLIFTLSSSPTIDCSLLLTQLAVPIENFKNSEYRLHRFCHKFFKNMFYRRDLTEGNS